MQAGEKGKWLPKYRKVYDLDENGKKIRLPSGRALYVLRKRNIIWLCQRCKMDYMTVKQASVKWGVEIWAEYS